MNCATIEFGNKLAIKYRQIAATFDIAYYFCCQFNVWQPKKLFPCSVIWIIAAETLFAVC
jgi:hypothetical protein